MSVIDALITYYCVNSINPEACQKDMLNCVKYTMETKPIISFQEIVIQSRSEKMAYSFLKCSEERAY